jgi:hypothetical protein
LHKQKLGHGLEKFLKIIGCLTPCEMGLKTRVN